MTRMNADTTEWMMATTYSVVPYPRNPRNQRFNNSRRRRGTTAAKGTADERGYGANYSSGVPSPNSAVPMRTMVAPSSMATA